MDFSIEQLDKDKMIAEREQINTGNPTSHGHSVPCVQSVPAAAHHGTK